METLGGSQTFLIYGVFALAGVAFIWRLVPETRGRSLEELEDVAGARTPDLGAVRQPRRPRFNNFRKLSIWPRCRSAMQ